METRELLEKMDANLGEVLGSYRELSARLDTFEEGTDEHLKRIKALDEKTQTMEEWVHEIEANTNKSRYNPYGGDGVLEVMDEDLKAWIPRVSLLKGGDMMASDPDSGIVGTRRPSAIARMAQQDPVKYVAIGGWFRARIKAYIAATRDAQPLKAEEWNKQADKIAEALGGITPQAKAALQEDTADEGGNLVPTITEAMIGWILKDASRVRASGPTTIAMTSKTHNLPTLANDFSVAIVDEEGTIGDSAPASPFGSGALTAKKIAGLVTMSIELIQDNIINLMDFLMVHLLNRYGVLEDAQALEGTGAGSNFSGLFTVSGTAAIAGGSNALSNTELVKLIYGQEEGTTIGGGSVIYAHPWIVRDAMLLETSGGGHFLPFIFNNQATQNTPFNLLGVPAYMTAAILRNRGGGTNETTAYHGNPLGLVIGDRMGTTFDVNPWSETEFKAGQVLLRLVRRVGILVWIPGYFTKLTAVTLAA